ncbi:hypothetical protein yc1106_05370 [Curvularia clavata]|uniref:Uncharacterized protein n=1 Tax=Curvularia clavata TaxID=95742 RepID=A0A9Q9DU54_CURCL|nr:hypothetical protein yc1106_05370 [Curvularia clavata]
MQHRQPNLSPLPDIGRAPSAPPRFPPRSSSPPLPPTPGFIIIGLFALSLTKQLIESLEYYPCRDADIIWLVNFLAPFSSNDALAKISGRQKDEYTHMYPIIVSRMKKQPRFPIRFMQMNPDRSLLQPRGSGGTDRSREMTDAERREIIDFCDAAAEWGSNVPIPAREADKMIELAGQRRIADPGLEQRQSRFQPATSSPETRGAYPAESLRRGDESALQGQGRADPRDRRGRRVSFADGGQDFEMSFLFSH